MIWIILVNYGAILFGIAWIISLIITILMDKDKREKTNKQYRIIKRGLSVFGIALALIITAINGLMAIPNYAIFIVEAALFLFAIIILYTNKKLGA